MNYKLQIRKFSMVIFTLVLSFVIYHLSFIIPASAHVVIFDRNIGATLHVDPDDDPIAGSMTSFFFDFKDRTNKFVPGDCDCTFIIFEDGQQIFSQPLFQDNTSPSLTNASIFYTFPQRDVYQVKVIGRPLTQGQFQDFTLNYDIRVDRQIDQSSSPNANSTTTSPLITTQSPLSLISSNLAIVIGAGILAVLLVILVVIKLLMGKKKSPPIAPTQNAQPTQPTNLPVQPQQPTPPLQTPPNNDQNKLK